MNTIILSKEDPEIAKAVAGCEVGVPQQFTITATPVSDDENLLVAKIDAIEYSETQEEPAVEEAEPVVEPEEAPYKPKAKKSSAIAVEDY